MTGLGQSGDSLSPEDRAWRNGFKEITRKAINGTDEEAEVILQRIADRLGGYTHAEAIERNPMPEPPSRGQSV